MHRVALSVTMVFIAWQLGTMEAYADSCSGVRGYRGTAVCWSASEVAGGAGGTGRGGGVASTPIDTAITIRKNPDTSLCRTSIVDPTPDGTSGDYVGSVIGAVAPSLSGCPTVPAGPGGPALPDPATFARSYADTLPLPVPDPWIAPGEMIVGWKAYLEARMDLSMTFSDSTPFGPITIEARGELWVDWHDGDGWAGPYPSAGGPFPDGDVWNVYTDPGSYDIEVQVRWIADWAFLGQTGTINDGLVTEASLADFPVVEAQSVIGS